MESVTKWHMNMIWREYTYHIEIDSMVASVSDARARTHIIDSGKAKTAVTNINVAPWVSMVYSDLSATPQCISKTTNFFSSFQAFPVVMQADKSQQVQLTFSICELWSPVALYAWLEMF